MGSGIGRITNHPDYYLSDGSVSFLTENIRFRVHKTFFTRESEFFCNLFDSAADEDPQAGSDECPFRLDVAPDAFAELLWVWYDRDYCFQRQTKERWVTILQLATRWEFPRVKALAVRELDTLDFSPVERISLYNKHGIDSDQLLSSYVELCRSPTVPSPADCRLMEMETLINILQARESAQLKAAELGHESPTSASLEDLTLRDIVSKFFKRGSNPRSNGISTGSEVRASSLNGEHTPGSLTYTTITMEEPQIPNRKVHPTGDAVPQSTDKERESREQSSNEKVEGEDQRRPGETTQDKEGEKEEKARQKKEKREKAKREKELEAKEKAQQAQQSQQDSRSKPPGK